MKFCGFTKANKCATGTRFDNIVFYRREPVEPAYPVNPVNPVPDTTQFLPLPRQPAACGPDLIWLLTSQTDFCILLAAKLESTDTLCQLFGATVKCTNTIYF